jgi:hypothetical protein
MSEVIDDAFPKYPRPKIQNPRKTLSRFFTGMKRMEGIGKNRNLLFWFSIPDSLSSCIWIYPLYPIYHCKFRIGFRSPAGSWILNQQLQTSNFKLSVSYPTLF